MTEEEYKRKREAYASSSADIEVIEDAIAKLDERYSSQRHNKTNLILQDIEDSQADYADIGEE